MGPSRQIDKDCSRTGTHTRGNKRRTVDRATVMSKDADKTALNVQKKTVGTPFKSGEAWNGNRTGRPKGSRSKLSESFIQSLCEGFEKNGVQVIETVRTEKPSDYLKIIAAIVPKELNVRDMSVDDMSDEELLEALDEVRAVTAALAGAAPTQGSRKAGRNPGAGGKPN